jgi:hypothetical protein
MKKIPMLEKFAAQSLVEFNGELIFSKEKFAELIVQECINVLHEKGMWSVHYSNVLKEHFGVEE